MSFGSDRLWFLFLSVALSGLLPGSTRGETPRGRSFLGESPPELVSRAEHWLNADKPLKLRQLKGRVVWLSFNF